MTNVEFIALPAPDGSRDGEGGWQVKVDGKVVIERLRNSQTDIADNALNPLWAALGVNLTFDQE